MICYPEFFPDIFSIRFYGSGEEAKEIGYLLGRFILPDIVDDLEFPGGKFCIGQDTEPLAK